LGPSQHICGIVLPLFLPTFHHLPQEFQLIVPVTETIDSVDFHIHTIPVTDYSKYDQFSRYIPVSSLCSHHDTHERKHERRGFRFYGQYLRWCNDRGVMSPGGY